MTGAGILPSESSPPPLSLYFPSEAAKPGTAQRIGFGPWQLGHAELFEPLAGKHSASLRVEAPTNLTLIFTLAHERAKGLAIAACFLLSCPLGDAEAHLLPSEVRAWKRSRLPAWGESGAEPSRKF